MCHTYFFKKYFLQDSNIEICYADTDISLDNYENPLVKSDKTKRKRQNNHKNRIGNFQVSEFEKDANKSKKWIYQMRSEIQREGITYANSQNLRPLGWGDFFCIEFNLNEGICQYYLYIKRINHQKDKLKRRFPKPDLVLQDKNSSDLPVVIKIIDYKNVSIDLYYNNKDKPIENAEAKYREDIVKQLTYELALQQYYYYYIVEENIFFIPYFYDREVNPDFEGEFDKLEINGIKIFKADFYLIQSIYLGNIDPIGNQKVRIYDLSKELSLDNKDILDICEKLNIFVKSHSSKITESDADQIRNFAKQNIRRTRKKPSAITENTEKTIEFEKQNKPQIIKDINIIDIFSTENSYIAILNRS